MCLVYSQRVKQKAVNGLGNYIDIVTDIMIFVGLVELFCNSQS